MRKVEISLEGHLDYSGKQIVRKNSRALIMVRTIVFVGKFLGQLNNLKEAIETAEPGLRCISFIETEHALKILMKDNLLSPDFIMVDESFPSVHFPLLKTLRNSRSHGAVPIILFMRASVPAPDPLPGHVFIVRKSTSKKDYVNSLRQVLENPANFAVTAG